MEDHDAPSGALLIEFVGLVLTATPYPNHIVVGLLDGIHVILESKRSAELRVGKPRMEHICRNVVSSFSVDWMTVDDELKVRASRVEYCSSNSIQLPCAVKLIIVLVVQHESEFISIWSPNVPWPPVSGLFDDHIQISGSKLVVDGHEPVIFIVDHHLHSVV